MTSIRPTWIEIDRAALANNVARIRQIIGPDRLLMAVVKANAYGHGAVETTRLALEAGADQCAVAALNEALVLRDGGIDAPILILGYTPGHLAGHAIRRRVRLTVFDRETLNAVAAAADAAGERAGVHVKINTGMNRLGVDPAESADFLRHAAQLPQVNVEGIFTHFATADETDKRHTLAQFEIFRSLLAQLDAAGLRPPIAHAANSAAALTLPETHLEMVRTGIALYGMDPDADETPLPPGFRPVLSWKAQIAQVRTLAPGHAVSYGREFVANRPMTIGVIPVGYADGFPRKPFNWGSVLVRGCPAPLVGRVCMDQAMIDLTEIAQAAPIRPGEEVVLIGAQGNARLSAEEAGRRTGTINYDVTSRILARVPRLLV